MPTCARIGSRSTCPPINARPAAGIYQTGLAGVNLPWAAVRMMLCGDPGDLPRPRIGGRLVMTDCAIAVPPVRDLSPGGGPTPGGESADITLEL